MARRMSGSLQTRGPPRFPVKGHLICWHESIFSRLRLPLLMVTATFEGIFLHFFLLYLAAGGGGGGGGGGATVLGGGGGGDLAFG